MGMKIAAALASIRRQYRGNSLDITKSPADPMILFEGWFNDVISSKKILDANAMCLSTVDKRGHPHNRIVLLKGIKLAEQSNSKSAKSLTKLTKEPSGFIFYTNYESAKGKQLAINPYVALNFWWPSLVRQVRVCGRVSKLSKSESDEYFATRNRGSRLSAWASSQSQQIETYDALLGRMKKMEDKFSRADVPRPGYWGGYILKPTVIEFWEGRINRLHARVLYQKKGQGWVKSQLAP